MKPITITFLATVLCANISLHAQNPQKLNLDRATVFLKGAELVSSAKVNLSKGENEFLFSNVAGSVDNQSVVVNGTNGVLVQSVTFQNNYTATDNVSPKVKAIKDSIEILEAKRSPIANKLLAINEQLTVLLNNKRVYGDNTGLNVAELQKLLDLVGAKMESLHNLKDKLEADDRKLGERIVGLTNQLSEEQKKDYQPGGQLLVKLFAKEATSSNISVAYIVPNAGWQPSYDIHADDSKGPVKFFYKANIYQNSGVKWDKVLLTLSTGNPDEGMQVPELSPWYLSFYTKSQSGTYAWAKKTKTTYDTVEVEDPVVGESMKQIIANEVPATMDNHVAVDNGGVNSKFDIDLPYTIPSDGQQHLVAVKQYEKPALYEYYAAPKADNDAFLLAKITDWQDLNLLPGKTNIFYEGTYVGQGYIDTRNIKDTMSISLGRDKKIIIKRERDKNLRSVKMIGSNVREEYAYNITVRNTRKEAITILLQDQMPVSNDKDIVIEDKETASADYDEATGMLKWPVTLKANETKTIKFGYTLKYPKGKTIQ